MEIKGAFKAQQVRASPADMSTGCIWENLFEEESALSSPFSFIYAVAAAVALSCTSYLVWQHQKFQLKKQTREESYSFFSIFIFAMHLRAFTPKLCRFLIKYAKPVYVNCEACALLETFLEVFLLETLTHACIDRYVVAKYIAKGWPINKNHYDMYLFLCLFFSFLYATPPVFGLGNYGLDFDCESCTFNMVLPRDWTRYIIGAMWFLRSVKPVIVMLMMLSWTRKLEMCFTNEMKIKNDMFFTRIVEIVVTTFLVGWMPMGVVRGNVVWCQFLYDQLTVPPLEYIDLALILYEMSPILVTIAIVLANRALSGLQEERKEFNEKQE